MNEFQLIDQYMRILRQDPNAESPPGLSSEAAAFIKKLVCSRQITPTSDMQIRVWDEVLAEAQSDQSNRDASHDPWPGSMSFHPNGKYKENNSMQTVLTYPKFLPPSSTRSQSFRLLRLVVAMIAFAMLVAFLLPNMFRDKSPSGPVSVFISQQAANKATFERYINEVWNTGDTTILDEIVSDSYVRHSDDESNLTGIEALSEYIVTYRATVPDVLFTIESISAEENDVWARLTFIADGSTHEMMTTVHFVNGKIAEEWVQPDLPGTPPQTDSDDPFAMEAEFLFDVNLNTDYPRVGAGGNRSYELSFVINGGTVEGSQISGEVTGGNIFQVSSDPVIFVAEFTFLPEDGSHLISVQFYGVDYPCDQGNCARITAHFDTQDERYDWLNRTLAIGVSRDIGSTPQGNWWWMWRMYTIQ